MQTAEILNQKLSGKSFSSREMVKGCWQNDYQSQELIRISHHFYPVPSVIMVDTPKMGFIA